MCLVTRQNISKIAETDIQVYKILVRTPSNILKSPAMWKINKWTYRLNTEYKLAGFIDRKKHGSLEFEPYDVLYQVRRGFHTYTTLDDALYAYNNLLVYNPDNFEEGEGVVIFEAIIPKGSQYAISTDGKEIVSNRIKIVREA
jgi:hypothetical protein